MKAPTKIALGLLAVFPFPLILLFFGSFFYLIQYYPKEFEAAVIDRTPLVPIVNLFLTVVFAAPQIFFVVHAARNPNIDAMRTTWVLCILLFGPFAFPFYWYHHIWRDGQETPRTGPLGLNDLQEMD